MDPVNERATAERPAGIVFVVSGPSGSGKGEVLKSIRADRALGLEYSVSCTTRPARPGEEPDRDYHEVTETAFLAMVERGEFLEHTHYAGNYYGTPLAPVMCARAEGQDVLLEVEVRGAGSVRAQVPDAVLILLIAPSHAELVRRLLERETRNGRTEADLGPRLAAYHQELSGWSLYDHLIINDRIEEASDDLRAIIRAERLACRRLDVRGYLEKHFREDVPIS
jgi:guanylate kinase